MKFVLLIAKILVTAFWLFFIVYIAAASLPHNPLSPRLAFSIKTQVLLPQAWGFFTKNPRDVDVYVYSKNGASWESALLTPNSSAANLLGLKRNSRSQGSEYAIIIDKVTRDKIAWSECKDSSHFECFEDSESKPAVDVDNTVSNPTLCGPIWIVLQKPVPWAWAKHGRDSIHLPLMFLKLNVHCTCGNP